MRIASNTKECPISDQMIAAIRREEVCWRRATALPADGAVCLVIHQGQISAWASVYNGKTRRFCAIGSVCPNSHAYVHLSEIDAWISIFEIPLPAWIATPDYSETAIS